MIDECVSNGILCARYSSGINSIWWHWNNLFLFLFFYDYFNENIKCFDYTVLCLGNIWNGWYIMSELEENSIYTASVAGFNSHGEVRFLKLSKAKIQRKYYYLKTLKVAVGQTARRILFSLLVKIAYNKIK